MRIILKVMKKKLEADLISVAHRILKLKNKEDVRLLHLETRKLYEKLSVLLFVEENFSDAKPTIGLDDIKVVVDKIFDFDEKIVEKTHEVEIIDNEPIIVHDINEEIVIETINEIKDEQPLLVDEIIENVTPEIETLKFDDAPIIEISIPEKKHISFDDFLTNMQPDIVFERVSDTKKHSETVITNDISKIIENKVAKDINIETAVFSDIKSEKPTVNLNDKLNKNINIGLNDKLAFEKQLFDGSSEDFNRVVSQISTFDNLEDAKNFIDEMVKPDYNNWKGKDEFAERFMEFVESKFV